VDFLYRRTPTGLVLALASPPSGLVASAADARSEPLVLEPATE
jgi:hypothetical protein